MIKRRFFYSKKGVSTTIEYILFISMAIALSVLIYGWVKTYVPKDVIQCADGVSVLIQDYNYDCDTQQLSLTLKNNGRFDFGGYSIHTSTSSLQSLATTDLSKYTPAGFDRNGFVIYSSESNANEIVTGTPIDDIFQLDSTVSSSCTTGSATNKCIYSLEVIPLRYESISEKLRPVVCTSAKVSQKIECTPPPTTGGGATSSCDGTWNAGSEDAGVVCDGGYKCIASGETRCTCETGYHADGTRGCVGNIATLFYDEFSATNPLQYSTDPWTSVCTEGSCGTNTNEIYTSTTDPITTLHDSYYMVTKNKRAVIKSIDTIGYDNINLNYWRLEESMPSNKDLIVQWKKSTDSTWTSLESSNPSETIWTQKTFSLTGAGNTQIQIRFYTNGGNNDYALFDDITATGQRI